MEGVKSCSVLLLMAVVLVAFMAPMSAGMKMGTDGTERWLLGGSTGSGCKGKTIGDSLGDEELGMDSEVSRRILGGGAGGNYLSYGALKRNSVPCKILNQAYSNCNTSTSNNPYNRGCSPGQRCRYGEHGREDN